MGMLYDACTGSFSKAGFSQEAVDQLTSYFLVFFTAFWTISIVKLWRPFILVLLNHTSKKKVKILGEAQCHSISAD